tara:strand:+ start:10866 stop:11387 length:522 start_codon:yes stop_codon:yes gene_type:complete
LKKYSIIEILYKDFSRFVNFAYTLLKSKPLSEDVVQDIFVQLLNSNSNHLLWIYDTGNGVSYINKIIAVRCLSKKSQFYKSQILYIKNKINVSETELEYLHNKHNTEGINVSEILNNQLRKIISTFDQYERDLFLLYYESGMSYEELSKQIGIPKISIYNTVRKIRKKIKQKI